MARRSVWRQPPKHVRNDAPYPPPKPAPSLVPQFHADGHFHSPNYPGHHTYQLQGTVVTINWGKYGHYTLQLNVAERTAAGKSAKCPKTPARAEGEVHGGDWRAPLVVGCNAGSVTDKPASWRRLTYVEPIAAHIVKEHGCGHAH